MNCFYDWGLKDLSTFQYYSLYEVFIHSVEKYNSPIGSPPQFITLSTNFILSVYGLFVLQLQTTCLHVYNMR